MESKPLAKLKLPCPGIGCTAWLTISPKTIAQAPTWGYCICENTRVAVLIDEEGSPKLARLVSPTTAKPLRKGQSVMVRHTATGIRRDGDRVWHTVETLSRGGQKPLDAQGCPIWLDTIEGIIEEEAR